MIQWYRAPYTRLYRTPGRTRVDCAKTYLAVAALAAVGWFVLYALVMPELLFDVLLGPFALLTIVQQVVTSVVVLGAAVVVFGAGVAFERYR